MHMLKTLIRNLTKKPATRNYPAEKRPTFPLFRGYLDVKIEDCIFCGACARKCPSHCITTKPREGFWSYDPFACVYCSACTEVCPKKCLIMEEQRRMPAPSKYMVFHKGTPKAKPGRTASMTRAAGQEPKDESADTAQK